MDAVCERVRRVAVTCHDDDHCVPDVEDFFMSHFDNVVMSEASGASDVGGGGGVGGDGGGGTSSVDLTISAVTSLGTDQWTSVEVRFGVKVIIVYLVLKI